jgi:HAD superfamily hydrolase (TIGR01549 family)
VKKLQAIIFDLDGTLFQTEIIAVSAFERTFRYLKENGLFHGPIPSATEIQSVFGMTHVEIWRKLLPEESEVVRARADELMLENELSLLSKGQGACYPDVEETLKQLQQAGWNLFIASNGSGPYVRKVLDSKNLTHYFQWIYTAGEHGTKTKEELVAKCIKQHGISKGYMVGDRSSDVKAGKANGITVIGCRYAGFPQFGQEDELAEADYTIHAFKELLTIVSL